MRREEILGLTQLLYFRADWSIGFESCTILTCKQRGKRFNQFDRFVTAWNINLADINCDEDMKY